MQVRPALVALLDVLDKGLAYPPEFYPLPTGVVVKAMTVTRNKTQASPPNPQRSRRDWNVPVIPPKNRTDARHEGQLLGEK
jgi:hypothetical protein